jgi:hypothetical protein
VLCYATNNPFLDSPVVCRSGGIAAASRHKYTLSYFLAQRAKTILLAAEGLSNDKVAARLDRRREVVGRWRKRFFTDRLQGLEEQARPVVPGLFLPDLVV